MGNFFKRIKQIFKKKPEIKVSEKTLIRQQVRRRKNQIDPVKATNESDKVFHKIEHMEEFQQAKTILVYWSMEDELNSHDFVVKWSEHKQILLPVVKDYKMYIMPFSSTEKLVRGDFGIWQPDSQQEYIEAIDIAIIPGVAFDREKNRLGRGRGYYDKYLENNKIKKWGVGYDFQFYEVVPTDIHDIKMNKVFTASFTIE